jgi:hypothetical protein
MLSVSFRATLIEHMMLSTASLGRTRRIASKQTHLFYASSTTPWNHNPVNPRFRPHSLCSSLKALCWQGMLAGAMRRDAR